MVSSSRIPGRSKPSMGKPHFFKILLGDFKQRLKIPPKFMKHISKEASQRVILQGPSGSRWKVKLSKTMRGNFLSSGWSNFVKDHCLREQEFLLFRYDGNMHFGVMIFDTTACEREDVFEMDPRKSKRVRKNKRGRPRKHPSDANSILRRKSSTRKHASPNSARNAIISTEDVDLPLSEFQSKTLCSTKRHHVTTVEKSKTEEAAHSFHSSYPYTIVRMTKYQAYTKFTVKFRACFSRIHLPRVRTTMILKDPSGKDWPVIYIPSNRNCLSKGWSAFARGNKIEEGDFCAFVLTGKFELKVHIFRAVQETSSSGQITVTNP